MHSCRACLSARRLPRASLVTRFPLYRLAFPLARSLSQQTWPRSPPQPAASQELPFSLQADLQASLELLEELAVEEAAASQLQVQHPEWAPEVVHAPSRGRGRPASLFQDAALKVLAAAGRAGDQASCDRVVALLIQAPTRRLSPAIVRAYLGIMAASSPPQHARALAFCAMVQGAEAAAYRAAAAELREAHGAVCAVLASSRAAGAAAAAAAAAPALPPLQLPPLFHVLPEGAPEGAYCSAVLKAQGKEALAEALALALHPASQVHCIAAASMATALAASGQLAQAQAWASHASSLLEQAGQGGEYEAALLEAAGEQGRARLLQAALQDSAITLELALAKGAPAGSPGAAATTTTTTSSAAAAAAAQWRARADAAARAAALVSAAAQARLPLRTGPGLALSALLDACLAPLPHSREAAAHARGALLPLIPGLYLAALATGSAGVAQWNRVLHCLSGSSSSAGSSGASSTSSSAAAAAGGIFRCASGALDMLAASQAWHAVLQGPAGGSGRVAAAAAAAAAAQGQRHPAPLPPPSALSRAVSVAALNHALQLLHTLTPSSSAAAPEPATPPASHSAGTAAGTPSMLAHDLLTVAWSWQGLLAGSTQPFLACPDTHTFNLALGIARRARDVGAQRGILGLIRAAGVMGVHEDIVGSAAEEEEEEEGEEGGVGSDSSSSSGSSSSADLTDQPAASAASASATATHPPAPAAAVAALQAKVARVFTLAATGGLARARAREELVDATNSLYALGAAREAVGVMLGMAQGGFALRGDTLSLHIKGLLGCGEGGAPPSSASSFATATATAAYPELCLPYPAKGERETFVCADLQGLAAWLARYREAVYMAALAGRQQQEQREQQQEQQEQLPLPSPAAILAALPRAIASAPSSPFPAPSHQAQAALVHALQGFALQDFEQQQQQQQQRRPAPTPPAEAAAAAAAEYEPAALPAPLPPLTDPLQAYLPVVLSQHTACAARSSPGASAALLKELSDAGDGRLSRSSRSACPLRLAHVFAALYRGGVLGPGRGAACAAAGRLAPSCLTLDVQGASADTLGLFLALLVSEVAVGGLLGGEGLLGVGGGGRHLVLVTGGAGGFRSIRAAHALGREAWVECRPTLQRSLYLPAEGLQRWVEWERRRVLRRVQEVGGV